jgi:hypothetical protein
MTTSATPPPDPQALLRGAPAGLADALAYPFFQSVFDRKSRRMGLGMSMPGTLAYDSPYEAVPLTELEEALLLVAGTGLNGLNLGDIDPSMGADALVQWTARTWPSSCSNHGTELFFTNDDGLFFLDMWNLMPEPGELSTLQGKSVDHQVEWSVKLAARRCACRTRGPRCRPGCPACSCSTTGTPTSPAPRSSYRCRT